MADSTPFQQGGLGWRFQLWRQQMGEQMEYQLRRLFEWLDGLLPENFMGDGPDWDFEGIYDWGNLLSGLLLGLICGLIGLLLYRLLRQYWRTAPFKRRIAGAPVMAEPPRNLNQWLKEARLAQRQGDYRLACQALYQATLQLLDERDWVAQQSSRTDQEYLGILRRQAAGLSSGTRVSSGASAGVVLIQTHEQLEFGGEAASAETWERCEQAYQSLQTSPPPQAPESPRPSEPLQTQEHSKRDRQQGRGNP